MSREQRREDPPGTVGGSLKPGVRDPAVGRAPARTGNKGHRLSPVPVRSGEIKAREAAAREAKPVTVRFVDPVTLPDKQLAPTKRQVLYLIDLERLADDYEPIPQTRAAVSRRISRLRKLAKGRPSP